MINESGLKPLGKAVLVKPYTPERRGGLIEIPENIQGRQAMIDHRAVVVEVGEDAWSDEGFWKPFLYLFRRWVQRPRAKAGDRVMVAAFSGFMSIGPADGQQYRLVNDRDLFCGITYEGASVSKITETEREVANG